ncbi:MAG: hypothetical protein ACTSU5_00025 [Promethearchaeota archaeon]
MPNRFIQREDIEVLAFRLYRESQPYEKMVWRLAELCETIKKTIDGVQFFNSAAVNPLEIADTLQNRDFVLTLKKPTQEETRVVAEKLHHQHPSKAELHWFIAEKTLLLKKLLDLYGNGSPRDF